MPSSAGKHNGELGLAGEHLGDLHPGRVGGDRAPGAAVLRGVVGLHVPQVDVAGAALEPEDDDAGVPGRGVAARLEDAVYSDRPESTGIYTHSLHDALPI